MPLDPERVVALRRVSDAVFKRPVAFGEEIHVEGRVQELRPVGDEAGIVGCRWAIVNSRGAAVHAGRRSSCCGGATAPVAA